MRIGIIGAFDAEILKFIELFKMEKEDVSYHEVYYARVYDKDVYVMRSGIGKVNAAATTQFLIDRYQVDMIINSGCAGSLLAKVKIMDVVFSSYVTYHDFSPTRIMEYSMPDQGKVKASSFLVDKAVLAIGEMESYNYFIGPICSGDCFVTDDKMRDEIQIKTGAMAVDMESASIGHIAALNRVPFVSIRTISDFADGEDDFEEVAAYKSSHLVAKMLEIL